ncbi:hypothetical protein [Hymenobacter sp. BT491]|uniref:hypothetical protein n=1 Tax=Hymenobacter sp. BT491 TaxID=2766779 RepID=UPI0016536746|nr:hypothetical protein [Hymenobacter sp. BT491]MBC6991183.1 hypothetical protein [Hymenobacter sp. BT491]
MRHFYFLILFFVPLLSQAQDVILQTNGEETKGKVLAISPEQVTYVSGEAGKTDTLQLAAASVFLIRYANGTKEVLHDPAAPTASEGPTLTSAQAYEQGRLDARKYYKSPAAFWGTFGTTLVTLPAYGLGGIVTGAVVGSTAPPATRFVVPDARLLTNADYVSGYRKQAQNKKLGQAAAGYGAGMGAGVLVTMIFIAALFSAH